MFIGKHDTTVTYNVSFVIKTTETGFVQFDSVEIVIITSYLLHGGHLLFPFEQKVFVVSMLYFPFSGILCDSFCPFFFSTGLSFSF